MYLKNHLFLKNRLNLMFLNYHPYHLNLMFLNYHLYHLTLMFLSYHLHLNYR
jgi:hypothetical protein